MFKRTAAKSVVTKSKPKGKIRDYIVRINIDTLRSVAVISVPATSRKHAVELVKGAIELTGEVAPINLGKVNKNMFIDEEIIEAPASEVAAEEVAPVAEEIAE